MLRRIGPWVAMLVVAAALIPLHSADGRAPEVAARVPQAQGAAPSAIESNFSSRSDPPAASARRAAQMSPATPSATTPVYDGVGIAENVVEYEGQAYFDGGRSQLFRIEAGATAAELFFDFGSPSASVYIQGVFGNLLYITAERNGGVRELWVSNGTVEGTMQLLSTSTGYYRLWHTYDGWTYFGEYADIGVERYFKLFRTQGTAETTAQVDAPGFTDRANDVYIYPTGLAIAAQGGFFWLSGVDRELWLQTAAGFRRIKSFATSSGTPAFHHSQFAIKDEVVYFLAQTMDGAGAIWRSDGTEAGTEPIVALRVAYFVPIADTFDGFYFHQLGDGVILFEQGVEVLNLHRFDLSAELLEHFATISSPLGRTLPTDLFTTHVVEDELVFSVSLGEHAQFWKTAGTSESTQAVGQPTHFAPYNSAVHTNGIAFLADTTRNVSSEPALFWLDGASGQILLLQHLGLYLFEIPQLRTANEHMYYTAYNLDGPRQLWQFDPDLLSPGYSYLPLVAQQRAATIEE